PCNIHALPAYTWWQRHLMIEAVKLCKNFKDKKRGDIHAVDSVSFTCKPGEIYGLLGANGAGKTTTLRILATILAPSSGTANVAGFDVVREPQKVRAHVGFLSTATALYDRLTAAETVEYFDEPTNGLDVMAARSITDFIRQCRDRGKTVIFSTHVMTEVEKLCDHIGIIHGGRMRAEGTLEQLRQNYRKQSLEEIFVEVSGDAR